MDSSSESSLIASITSKKLSEIGEFGRSERIPKQRSVSLRIHSDLVATAVTAYSKAEVVYRCSNLGDDSKSRGTFALQSGSFATRVDSSCSVYETQPAICSEGGGDVN